jgi:GT2 family glycosyltransferase
MNSKNKNPRKNMLRRFPSACTIISRSYLSHARVLANSYQQHHRGAKFYLLVVDGLPAGVEAGAGIRLIDAQELNLPYWPELCFKYDVTELCTAVKPTLLSVLLKHYHEEEVLYLDPDILVVRRLDELLAVLASAHIVLTPHLLKPLPMDGLLPSELEILIAGAYNLGFIAVRKTDEVEQFLAWWEARLRDGCYVDVPRGLMTDQRWIDLVPGLFSAAILKDETYNVAYWNIHSRVLECNGKNFTVNGRPLAFFHFSGFDPANPTVLSKHQNRTRIEEGSPLADLLDLYVELQVRRGFATCSHWRYGFGAFDNGVAISTPMRRLYVNLRPDMRQRFADPLRTSGNDSFLDWATRRHAASDVLSPFLRSLYDLRPDVAADYPDVAGKDREGFLRWACTDGPAQHGYDPGAMRIKGAQAQTRSLSIRAREAGAARTPVRPKCSIIIPVHNAPATRRCLDSILATEASTDNFEIILANHGSSDHTAEVLRGYGDGIRVANGANHGFSASCNAGGAMAHGEYLVFLDSHAVPQPGWLEALVQYAERHPKAAVVGSKLLNPHGIVRHAGTVICEDGEPRCLYAGFPGDHPAVNHSRRFQAVAGACFLTRRQDFDRVRGFDTGYHQEYADVDLCLRLSELGCEIHYCHESVVHLSDPSTGNGQTRQSEPQVRDRELYRERWSGRVRPDDLRYYLEDALLKIDCRSVYPIGFLLSPLLASVNDAGNEGHAERILAVRSRQVVELLKENIRLNSECRTAERRPDSSQVPGERHRQRNDPSPIAPPRLIRRGRIHWLSSDPGGQLVSVILPVKNGAPKLRDLLPAILAQRSRHRVEIIAVDSGSRDESVDLLVKSDATVVSIDPRSFNHGLTRNLATRYASGSILVFLNQSTLPANDQWLTNLIAPFDEDPALAGVCGRVLPRPDADLLTAREVAENINASVQRIIQEITDRESYRSLRAGELRLFVNFHSLSAAIRADVFQQIPFREADFAEDLIWGKEALEAGFRIRYEPSSVVLHSHNYTLLDIFRRNFDDGAACRRIVGKVLEASDVVPMIVHHARKDWRFLENECRLQPGELEQWRLISAMRRAAEAMGQWIGSNCGSAAGDFVSFMSITEQIKAGVETEDPETWGVRDACTAG